MDKQIEILRFSLYDPDPDVRNATARVVNQAAQTVLGMKARADEGTFRRQTVDTLSELLTIIREEESRRTIVLTAATDAL